MDGAIACTALCCEQYRVQRLKRDLSGIFLRSAVLRNAGELLKVHRMKRLQWRLVESSDSEYQKNTIQSCTACTTAKSKQKLKARLKKTLISLLQSRTATK